MDTLYGVYEKVLEDLIKEGEGYPKDRRTLFEFFK